MVIAALWSSGSLRLQSDASPFNCGIDQNKNDNGECSEIDEHHRGFIIWREDAVGRFLSNTLCYVSDEMNF